MGLLGTDLTIARGCVPFLAERSFELLPGRALILRGPNGSGKTTLLRTVAGLQPATAGEIRGAEEAVAYAGHADGLKATLSVAENLRFWAEVFGCKRGIYEALHAFDLEALADRLSGRLSAGQKRRLGRARLLVTGRPIWVVDEPTVSLDAASVGLFAAAVRAHLEAGGMALMATHVDLGLAEAEMLEVSAYRADPLALSGSSDEVFL